MRWRSAGAAKGGSRALWAWTLYDWATQSYATIIHTFVFGAYFTSLVAANPERGATQWSLTIGLTGLAVALSGPFLGAIADCAGRRKPWLGVGTVVCAAATLALWFVRPRVEDVTLALALLAVASYSIHLAAIFYNAMLGDLASPQAYGRWSGRGWAMGYAGGLCCLATVFVLFLGEKALVELDRDTAQHVRAAFPFVGVWLLVFSIPIFGMAPDRKASGLPWREAVRLGLGQLRRSVKNVRRYRHTVRFLIAWALYSDGLATIFAMGGVYAAGAFGMDAGRVLLFGVGLSISAGLGAIGFSVIDDRIGSRRTILMALAGLLLFSTLILVVESEFWFWIYGLALGVFVGPAQASSRAYLSRTAPEEMRAQLFGVYALAGKATSFLGPLLVAGLTALFQSQRIGLAIIPVYFAAGWLILRGVPDAVPVSGEL